MSAVEPEEVQGRSVVSDNMVRIPGGTFRMGSDRHYPEEAPVHRVSVGGFWIDPTPVTNAQFRQFVRETRHVTFAERKPDPKDYPNAFPACCLRARWSLPRLLIPSICATGHSGGRC